MPEAGLQTLALLMCAFSGPHKLTIGGAACQSGPMTSFTMRLGTEVRLRDECFDRCTLQWPPVVLLHTGRNPRFFHSTERQCPRLNRTRSSMSVGIDDGGHAPGSGLTHSSCQSVLYGNTPGAPQTILLRVPCSVSCA